MSTFAYQVLKKTMMTDQGAVRAAAESRVRSFEAGATIWKKGAVVEEWSYVISGLVSESTPVSKAESLPLHVYGPRSWFGEQSIVLYKPTLFEFRCMTDVQLLAIPVRTLQLLWKDQPGFSTYVAQLLAWRVQKKTQMLALMKMGNPIIRVVMGIVLFSEALAYASARPPTQDADDGIEIPVNQTQMASLFGVSRTLLSDIIKKFERAGWLKVKYGKMEIKSLDTWRRFAGRRLNSASEELNPSIESILDELRESA
jgi:CRP-like cAMP-binding protein